MQAKYSVVLAGVLAFGSASAGSWYWPFGRDDESEPPRISELMKKPSRLIDEAADIAVTNSSAAVEKYREALKSLEKVERENPERATTSEFATVRNKRAYVNAAIDSLLLEQARANAKAVAVTDTTELEQRLAEKRAEEAKNAAGKDARARNDDRLKGRNPVPELKKQLDVYMEGERERNKEIGKRAKKARAEREFRERLAGLDPDSRKARLLRAGDALRKSDQVAARKEVAALLDEDPQDAAALNMLAACMTLRGDVSGAMRVLKQALEVNPKDYHAHYNLANLILQSDGELAEAKSHYEKGRACGGPEDENLEEAFK